MARWESIRTHTRTALHAGHLAAFSAAALALAYLVAATLAPALLLLLVPLTILAACAPAARAGTGGHRALALIAGWLVAALAGAWWLRDATTAGPAWILAVLFLAPLVLIPWLFAHAFEERA
jgi:hypothetical protein